MTCKNPVAVLNVAILSGDDGSLLLQWEDGSTGLTRQVDTSGIYPLQLSNSCQSVTEEIIVPAPLPEEGAIMYVPNAFSPNGDGKNDYFLPALAPNVELIDYEFKVFVRWGNECFDTKSFPEGWDGTVGGRKQGIGVYAWYIKSKVRNCGQEMYYFLEGDVMLMR